MSRDLAIGQTITHYRIVGHLGAGGMGVVYRAEDLRLGRLVALKFVSAELGHESWAVQRLRSEARAASALNHANICTIYDIDEHDGHPFIVMELMKGRTLRDCLAAGEPLKIHQVLDLGIEIADALHAAHSEGIIHRDIKPGNIFVTERGQAKILDFGLAKLTTLFESSRTTRDLAQLTVDGMTLGTVAYMSPEQATGEDLDGRTDLFSLGVVLYECATGKQPFTGKTSASILAAILNRAPVAAGLLNPDLPHRLQEVISNCLEKDRELRYQSAADLRADLKRVRRDIESGQSAAIVAARPASGPVPERSSAFQSLALSFRSNLKAWGLVAVAALGTLGLIGAFQASRNEAPPAVDARPVEPAADPRVESRLALATASFDAQNYRAALSYAEQVLALDPSHVEAGRIRERARGKLAEFDSAIAEARRRLAAGDLGRAEQALDAARGLDPGAPAVAEIAGRLANRLREQERAADRESRTRQAPTREAPTRSDSTRADASDTRTPPPQATKGEQPPEVRRPLEPSPSPSGTPGAPIGAIVAPPPPTPAVRPPEVDPQPSGAVKERPQPRPAEPTAEQDEAAIRRVIASYARAIETKDVALFRAIKPNLSREEERRLEGGFRAVSSQRVNLTVLSVNRRGDQAVVVLRRRDTIHIGNRQQTSETQQVLTLVRTGSDWTISEIR